MLDICFALMQKKVMNALTEFIKQKGLTAFKLSQEMGVAPSTVTRHLEGRGMSMDTAMLYHKAGVPWDVLTSMLKQRSEKDQAA